MQSSGIVEKTINRIANGLDTFTEKIENVKGLILERSVLLLYFIGHFFISFFHEPWFDEALSWLIARDSSIYEILFVTPHYEGHPSLWHLILVPFAKLGAPYELSLSIVSLLFSSLAMGLFIYKAPFKRIIRLTLPFTYYLFYQYGVISRPYCMMMLAFVILAMAYKYRNEKPGSYVLSLWFLCLTSAYGIVVAGGICIAWLVEMLIYARNRSQNKNSDNGKSRGVLRIFFEDYLMAKGKIIWLAALLGYVLFILWRIMPADDTYASLVSGSTVDDNGLGLRLLYTVFASISDLFVTNAFYTSGTLRNAAFYVGELLVAGVIGAAILACLITTCKRKKNRAVKIVLFIIPYMLLTVFEAIVYLFYHHIGISLLFIGFWLWVISDSKEDKLDTQKNAGTGIKEDNVFKERYKILFDFGKIALALMMIIPIYWTISSCVKDVVSSYGSGRKQYEFLEKNELDEGYTILAEWYKIFDEEEVPKDYTEYDLIFAQQGVNLAPYLTKSKIINSPEIIGKSYSYLYEIPEKQEMAEIYFKLSDIGEPDIIIGKPDFIDTEKTLEIYGSTLVDYNNYFLVFEDEFGNVKKGVALKTNSCIYVRKDLAQELGLKEVEK